MRNKLEGERLWRLAVRRWRQGSGKRKMAEEREIKGDAMAQEREPKLAKKRAGRSKKAAELERLKGVALVESFKALKTKGNDELADQLKVYKLILKKEGFKTTGAGPEMRRQLQTLIYEKFGASANDLDDGDSGLDGRAVNDGKRRARGGAAGAEGGKGKGKGKRKRDTRIWLHGWGWVPDEEFDIECLVGKMIADGGTVPGREGAKIAAGTVLYKVLWEGWPPELATWEEEDQIPCGEVNFVAQYEEALAAEAAAEAADDDADDA